PTELPRPAAGRERRTPACRPRRGPDGIRTRDLHLDRVASTAKLLHGTKLSFRTPNGIRTRVSALKGRDPRPLDDGGSLHRPRPWGSAESIASGRRSARTEEGPQRGQGAQRGGGIAHRDLAVPRRLDPGEAPMQLV